MMSGNTDLETNMSRHTYLASEQTLSIALVPGLPHCARLISESCNVLTEVEVWSRGQIMIDIMPVQNFREGDIHFDIKILPSFIHKRFQRLIVMEGHKTATALLPMSHHMR
jgi:hypothetical protein